ncbi:MAG: hypothetical protein NDJ92_20020 [Thermoanaerobaculia bacterium]|nr:hypothetical protein [Thermoanaerobaculia bacterium]
MIRFDSPAARRAFGRGALLLLVVLVAGCFGDEDKGKIPIGLTHDDLVVTEQPLEAALAASPVREATRSGKDDGATGWDHRFEEQVDPPKDGVVKRRFRVTIANRSDKVRVVRLELLYLTAETRERARSRALRLVVVPPFTQKTVSGYTQFLAERKLVAELSAAEIVPE